MKLSEEIEKRIKIHQIDFNKNEKKDFRYYMANGTHNALVNLLPKVEQLEKQLSEKEKQNKEFLAIIKELRTRLDKYERGEK